MDISSYLEPHVPVRARLGEGVTRYIRDSILAGRLPPGQRLVIRDIAELLQVSSMPVREALVSLASEGLIEGLPHRGFRVAAVPRRDIEDTFRVHAYIASMVAESAAAAATPELIGRLKEIQARIEDLVGDGVVDDEHRLSEIESLNHEFHRAINLSVDAARLRWFLRAAGRYVPRTFYYVTPGWAEATVAEHPQIIRALETGNGHRAGTLVEEHILAAGRLVVATLERQGFWDEPRDRKAGRRTRG